ncbi:hypothetical protein O6P43_022674 [Quillaja saponaria]|uniref:Uncharacterized protein n=1 Tax=Quillaja saponaria TaxID=32244 RepID=A0AAD7LDM6_QUISA|nr:hypothetical protein O6P43_022674 [Quillaja saponaria]
MSQELNSGTSYARITMVGAAAESTNISSMTGNFVDVANYTGEPGSGRQQFLCQNVLKVKFQRKLQVEKYLFWYCCCREYFS